MIRVLGFSIFGGVVGTALAGAVMCALVAADISAQVGLPAATLVGGVIGWALSLVGFAAGGYYGSRTEPYN